MLHAFPPQKNTMLTTVFRSYEIQMGMAGVFMHVCILAHWPLVNFNIMNDSVVQQLARQAPAAQDTYN